MNIGKNEKLTCTRCGEVKETSSALVYSQGELVCTECKKITQQSDNRAFDRDMNLRRFGG